MKTFWVLFLLVCLSGILIAESRREVEAKGSGIVFFNTTMLEEMKDFYTERIGAELWLDQGTCAILKYGNLLIGFCQSQEADLDTLITFFYEKKENVDELYEELKATARSAPAENKKYRIYHFYARDPEGRAIEFQSFLHPIDWDFGAYIKE
jgi:catechol-2,3-dioxygenase